MTTTSMTGTRTTYIDGMDVEEVLCLPVAELLWAVRRGTPDSPRLIFPFYRDGNGRVSEQESRVLMCQVLERSDLFYSVETPTGGMYQRLGQISRSASIDLTVYASRDATDRVLNVELKSGTTGVTELHRDLEKLVREGIEGLWFCTIERVDRRTIPSMLAHIRDALQLVREHSEVASHSIVIALCLLDEQVLLSSTVQLGTAVEENFDKLMTLDHGTWNWSGDGVDALTERLAPAVKRPIRTRIKDGKQTSRATRETLLIYCPDIAEDTFLHYSRSGESYKLRAFNGLHTGKAWRQNDAPSADEFMRTYVPEYSHFWGPPLLTSGATGRCGR